MSSRTKHPLSGYAASPYLAAREGDDTLGAGRRGRHRPFLGVPELGCASLVDRGRLVARIGVNH